MALLKDLIVQGASRFIGDAYFATIKAGVWNGTPIDLSHGGTAGTTTANKVLLSTTTSGTAAWSAWTSAGFLKTNASGVISIDTNTYITGNQTITLSGAVSGSGTTSITTSYAGTVPIDKGGTNATTAAGARANLGTWALISDSYNTLIASDGSTNGWIKIGTSNTSYGLLPSASGNAGSGHNYIGTSSWYWKYAYIDEIHGSLVGTATYASNVGASGTAGTHYVTAAKVIATCNWYDTMIASSDTDALINRWKEVVDFLNNFTEADTLASVLSTYVTLGTAQTITGAKTFANPISGDLLGNATTADRLKSTTAVGGAGTPVYFTGGLPVACTAANVRTFLGLGTVYSHAHTDYVTNVSFDSANRKLQLSKGGGTATDIVTFGTGAFATIADYLPLAGGTITGKTTFNNTYNSTDQSTAGIFINRSTSNAEGCLIYINDIGLVIDNKQDEASSSIVFKFSATDTEGNNGGTNAFTDKTASMTATKANGIVLSGLSLDGTSTYATRLGTSSAYLTYSNLSGVNGRTVSSSTAGYCAYYSAASTVSGTSILTFDTTNSRVGIGTTTPSQKVHISGGILSITNNSNTINIGSTNSSFAHFTSGVQFYFGNAATFNGNTTPYTNNSYNLGASSSRWKVIYGTGIDISGIATFSGATTIDSLTAGNLTVTGASTLTGNVSMGTVTAGTWNGSVINVAHGGTGCSTLTSGSALIGNGTGAVTFRSIDNTTTVGSLVNLTTWAASTNLVTRNVIAHWDGRYQTTSNASNLAYCNKGAFGDAATRTYATAISTDSGTTSATVNNYNSDSYVPTNKAVYNYVTSTLGVAATIEKTSITKSLNSSTWTETGYTLYGEEQGSYMLQIVDTTTSAVFTGVFSIYHADSATGNDLDEIPLHMCASATNKVRIYAATLNGKLLVSSQNTSATNHTLKIKYKKII